MWCGRFSRAMVKETSPVPPAMSRTSSACPMGAMRAIVCSQLLYAPKLETALNRSYLRAMREKMSFTRSEEI